MFGFDNADFTHALITQHNKISGNTTQHYSVLAEHSYDIKSR